MEYSAHHIDLPADKLKLLVENNVIFDTSEISTSKKLYLVCTVCNARFNKNFDDWKRRSKSTCASCSKKDGAKKRKREEPIEFADMFLTAVGYIIEPVNANGKHPITCRKNHKAEFCESTLLEKMRKYKSKCIPVCTLCEKDSRNSTDLQNEEDAVVRNALEAMRERELEKNIYDVEQLGYVVDTVKTTATELYIVCEECESNSFLSVLDELKHYKDRKICPTCASERKLTRRKQNSGRYATFNDFLEKLGYRMSSTYKDFESSRMVVFYCDVGHKNELSEGAFSNKKDKHDTSGVSFCSTCSRSSRKGEFNNTRQNEIQSVFEKFGHVFIDLGSDNKTIEFKCGSCGEVGSTNYAVVARPDYTGKCVHCANEKNRRTFASVVEEVRNFGYEILTKEADYTSNKNVSFWCQTCGVSSKYTMSLSDMRRRMKHYHCEICFNGVTGEDIRYSPLCKRCYLYNHPAEDTEKAYRCKEETFKADVCAFLETQRDKVFFFDPVIDRKIEGGCSKRRPDVLVECLSPDGKPYAIILECDENRHSGYSCENLRTCQLFEDLGEMNVLFLRLNPDSYTDANGTYHPSAFSVDVTGRVVKNEGDWRSRMKTFEQAIAHALRNMPPKWIHTEHFCFGREDDIGTTIITDWVGGKDAPYNQVARKLNRFRYMRDSHGDFLEVQLSNNLKFVCDVEHLDVVEEHVWSTFKKTENQRHYVRHKSKDKNIMFRALAYPSITNIQHLDGNPLNLRSHNVAER